MLDLVSSGLSARDDGGGITSSCQRFLYASRHLTSWSLIPNYRKGYAAGSMVGAKGTCVLEIIIRTLVSTTDSTIAGFSEGRSERAEPVGRLTVCLCI